MGTSNGRVVLVTGASSGIGKATAELLAREGFKVYGTSRKISAGTSESICEYEKGFLKMIQLDVCSEDSAASAVEFILKEEGRIDILINNAGFGIAGAIENTSTEEAQRQFDTNFFGMHRMCRKVLPVMRRQNQGIIINIGSVASIIPIPYQAFYSAAKAALDAYSEALSMEVAGFGIKVCVIEPGDTRTGFTSNRIFAKDTSQDSPYYKNFTKSITRMEHDEMNGPEPAAIARLILKCVRKKNPPLRVVAGGSYKLLALLKRILPVRLTVYIVSKLYG